MKFIAATLFSTLLLSGIAFAGNPVQPGTAKSSAPRFEEIDTNKDGSLSKSEATKVAGLDFDKADTNHDGKVSQAEYQAATSRMGG